MIVVHRPDGRAVYLNPDLIETVEPAAGGCRVTLVDGRELTFADDATAVADRITRYRAALIASAESPRPWLRGLPR